MQDSLVSNTSVFHTIGRVLLLSCLGMCVLYTCWSIYTSFTETEKIRPITVTEVLEQRKEQIETVKKEVQKINSTYQERRKKIDATTPTKINALSSDELITHFMYLLHESRSERNTRSTED